MENRKNKIMVLAIVLLLSIVALCLGNNCLSAFGATEGKNNAVDSNNLDNAAVVDVLHFEITYNGYANQSKTTNAHTVNLVGVDSSVDPDLSVSSTSTTDIMTWIDGKRLKGDGSYTDCEIGINFATATEDNHIIKARMYVNDAFVFAHGNYTFKNPEAEVTAQYDSLPKISPFNEEPNHGTSYGKNVLIVKDGATLTIASPFVFEGSRESSASVITVEQGGTFTVNCAKEGSSNYIGGVYASAISHPIIDNSGTIHYLNAAANAFRFGTSGSSSTAIKNSGTLNIAGQIVYGPDNNTPTFAGKIQVETDSAIHLKGLKAVGESALTLNFTQPPDMLIDKAILICDKISADTMNVAVNNKTSVVRFFFSGSGDTGYMLQVDDVLDDVLNGYIGKIIINKNYKNIFTVLGKDNSYTLTRPYTPIVGGNDITYSETTLSGASLVEIIAFIKANKTENPTIRFGNTQYNDLRNFSYSVANGKITIDFNCIISGDLFLLGTDGNKPVIEFTSGITVTTKANFYFGVGDGMKDITVDTRNSCGYIQNEGAFIINQGRYQTGSISSEGIFTRYNDNNLLLIKNSGTIQIDFLGDANTYLKILGFIERSTATAIVEIKKQGDYSVISRGTTEAEPIKVLVPYGTPIKDITPFRIGEGIQLPIPYGKTFNTYHKLYVATTQDAKVYFSSTYQPGVTTGSDGTITAGKTIHYTTKINVEGSIIGEPTAPEEFAVGTAKTLSIEDMIYHEGVAYAYAGMKINDETYSVGKKIYADFKTTEDFVVTFVYKIATFDNHFQVKKAADGQIEFYAHVDYRDIEFAFRDDYFWVCTESSFANAFEVLPILPNKAVPIVLDFEGYTDDIDLDLSYSLNKNVALSGNITGAVTIHTPLYDVGELTAVAKITLGADFKGDILVYNTTNFIMTNDYSFTLDGGLGTSTDLDGNIVKGIWTEDYTSYQISTASGGGTFDYAVKETFGADGQTTRYKVLDSVANVNLALAEIKALNDAHNSGGVHTIYFGTGQNVVVAPDTDAVKFHHNATIQGKISAAKGFSIAANATVLFDALELDNHVSVLESATLQLKGSNPFGTNDRKVIYIEGDRATVEDVGLPTVIGTKVNVAIVYDLAVGFRFIKTDKLDNFSMAGAIPTQFNPIKDVITDAEGYYIGLKVPSLFPKSEGVANGKVVYGDTWSITATISGMTSNLPEITYNWEYSVGGGGRIELNNITGATLGSDEITLTVGKYHIFYCTVSFTLDNVTSTSAEMKTSVLVEQKTIAVGAPTYSGAELAFGESLTNDGLGNSAFSQYGSYQFVDGQTAQGGTHAYNWIFVPNPALLANYDFQNVTGTIQLTAAERVYGFNYVIEQTGDTFTITDFNADKSIYVTVARGLSFVSNGVMNAILADIKEGIAATGSTPTQINIKFGDGINAIVQDGSFTIPEKNTYNYLISGKTTYTGTNVAIIHQGTGTLTTTADISSTGWAIANQRSGTVKITGGAVTSSGNTTVDNARDGTVILDGGTVEYTGSEEKNFGISNGDFGGKIELRSGTVKAPEHVVSVYRNVTLFGDVTLTSNKGYAQFYVGRNFSLTVDSSYKTINNVYTLGFETNSDGSVTNGRVAVNGTTDKKHFAVMNDGYEFAADTTNNQLNVIKSRTYYYNYTITKDGDNFVITDTSPNGTDATEVYRGDEKGEYGLYVLGIKIDADRKRSDNTYADCTITLGSGSDILDIGEQTLVLANGTYFLKGSVTGSGIAVIRIERANTSVTMNADIESTFANINSYAGAVVIADTVIKDVIVNGGKITALNIPAFYHEGNSTLVLSNATIISANEREVNGNGSGSYQGTISLIASTYYAPKVSIDKCRVENNSEKGVAVYAGTNAKSSITITNSIIIGAKDGVAAWLGDITIENSNVSVQKSGGNAVYGQRTIIIKSSTITKETTGDYAVKNGIMAGTQYSPTPDFCKIEISGDCTITGVVFTRIGVIDKGYTGNNAITVEYYNNNIKDGIQDGEVVIYGVTDASKWKLVTEGYVLLPDESKTNLIAKLQVTVTFDFGGVLENTSTSVMPGSKLEVPTNPTADGFVFQDWFTDSTFSAAFDFSKPITAPTTLYAKWTVADFTIDLGSDITVTYDGLTHNLTPNFTNHKLLTYTYQWYIDNVAGVTTESAGYKNVTLTSVYRCVVTATFGTETATAEDSVTVIVNKAVLTVTAENQTIVFGNEIAQEKCKVTGFVGNDTEQSVTIEGKPALSANALTVLYGNSISVDVSGMKSQNYTFSGVSGGLTIEKATYTSVSAHDALSETYDKGKTLADYPLNANYRWKTPLEKPTVAVTSYEAYYNADPANYNDFSVSILLTLSKQKITVPTINSKVYNGLTQTADLTANGYTVTANSGGKDARADYVVTLTLEDFLNTEWDAATGLSGTNNEILTLSFEITQRAITVTIADQRSAQGNDLVDLTTAPNAWQITVGSLVTGDNLGITLSMTADKNTVAVTAIAGTAANTNYLVTFVSGNYSVYSVAGFNDFMTAYGATIKLTPGKITHTQVAEINAMHLAYNDLDGDSLSQLTETQKANIDALKTNAAEISAAMKAAEDALNALNDFTAEDIQADGISTWKENITDAEQAVAAYTKLSTELSSADLVGHTNIAAAKTLTDNYDSSLSEANTALAVLKDKTAQGLVDGTYTKEAVETLLGTAKEKVRLFIAAGGKNDWLTDFSEIKRVESALADYDSHTTFITKHGETVALVANEITLADLGDIDAAFAAYLALSDSAKKLITQAQKDNISALKEKADAIRTAKSEVENALTALDGITSEGLRNGTFDLGAAETAIAAAIAAVKSYTDLSDGVKTADLADYGNIATAEKAVSDYKAYKAFADHYGDIYAKDPPKLTYPEAFDVDEMYDAYLLLTEDAKNVLTEEEVTNIAALKEKTDALIQNKEFADEALAALNNALTGGADKETLQDLLADALNKTEDFFSENGTTQSLPNYDAIQDSKDQISVYEQQEFDNQVHEDIGAIEDFTPDVVGGMDIPNLESTIDKVQDAIDKIDMSSDKTKEELKDKREELSQIKDNLTQKLNLENTKVAAISELKAEREQLLASSAYSNLAKKEIAEYYAQAIETIASATNLLVIAEHKDACIEEMNSVEILHVGLLVANLIFAVILIGEILFLVFRKKFMSKKKETKAYSSALPIALLAAASGRGLTVGVTFLVILILAVVVLGVYIVDKVLRESRGRTVISPIVDKVDGLVKKCADGAKKLFGKNTAEKAGAADLVEDAATVAVESLATADDTATVMTSGADAEAPQDIPSAPTHGRQSDGDSADKTAAAMCDEEETEVFERIEAHTGQVILIRYRKSFLAKLIQSSDDTKGYYSDCKNALLSYKKVSSRISWSYDSINLGRTKLAKFNVRGKTLYLYLALHPDDFTGTKYKVERTESKKYDATPCVYKVKNDKRAKYALDLIAKLAETFALSAIETKTKDYAALNPYDTTESLVSRGMIKELITKENYEAYLKRQSQQEVDDKKREFVSAREASSLLSDEVAATLIEEKRVQSAAGTSKKIGKRVRGIVNIDKISEAFGAGDTVTLSALVEKGLLSKSVNSFKILARGSLNKPLTVEANEFSMEAVKMIVLTGGKVIKLRD